VNDHETTDESRDEELEKKGTGFACVQLLNTVKALAKELPICDCETDWDGDCDIKHDPSCAHWQAAFVIDRFENGHMPTDAEIWMRVVSLISFMQSNRRRGTAISYCAVPETPMDELARIADGHPRAITDTYAAMESLRSVVARMQEKRAEMKGTDKVSKARAAGYRAAINDFIRDIEEVTNPHATNICAGLIKIFAAWLTQRPVPVGVDLEAMAEYAEDFISIHKLRRLEEKGD